MVKIMTMKEIAKKAGVSVATVSYVLNDVGRVSAETKDKIFKIINEEGYRPNRIAKGLREQRTKTIGILCEDVTAFQTPEIINGINQFMESREYHVILNDVRLIQKTNGDFSKIIDYRADIESAMNIFEEAQADGVIYVGLQDRDVGEILPKTNIPLVGVYCYDEKNLIPYITYDNIDIVREAINYFVKCGHQKIGLIQGDCSSKPAQKRFESFCRCLKDNHLLVREEYLFHGGDWEFDSGVKVFHDFEKLAEKPTAIFAMNDYLALGFMQTAQEQGYLIPKDISIIGFDNRECCRYSVPRLSTVDLPLKKMGYEAANKLYDIIHGESEETINKIILPCELLMKKSVMQPKE